MDLAEALGLGPESLSVVDVGAAFFGSKPFYQALLDDGVGRLFAFEPDESQHAALRPVLPASAVLLPYALGDGGRHTLHLGPSGMTSLLEPDPAAYHYYTLFRRQEYSPAAQAARTLPVETRRLDDVADIERMDFLKLDIQGAELMVLQNARERLKDCAVVQIEVPFVRLYRDQPSFGDLDAELSAQGFMVHGLASLKRLAIAPYAMAGPVAGLNQLVDLDMIYIRDFIRTETLSDHLLRASAMIADRCYGSGDLALRALVELERRGQVARGYPRQYFEGLYTRRRAVTQHHLPAPPA